MLWVYRCVVHVHAHAQVQTEVAGMRIGEVGRRNAGSRD